MTAAQNPPPDRGHLRTEQRLTASAAIDALSVEQSLRLINTQDIEVPKVVHQAIPAIGKLVNRVADGMRRGGRLIYVGAGSSGRLGVLDAAECPPTFHSDPDKVIGLIAGGDLALRHSSEGQEDDPRGAHEELNRLDVNRTDVVLGLAAGGTTPYVWGALRFASDHGAATGLICCVPLRSLIRRQVAPVVAANQPVQAPGGVTLPAPVDYPIELIVGPEVVTGSTRMKAGTATKLVLNMITTTTMVQLGKVWGNLMVDLRAANGKLRDRAIRILCSQGTIDRPTADRLLDEAGGRVKVALVMARLRISAEQAQQKINEHDDRLRPLLGPPRN